MQSKAKTVAEYLAELPEDRRKAIETVRQVVLKNLDSQYEEGMQYGMIGYYVPHRVHPAAIIATRNSHCHLPRSASQKNQWRFT